MTTLDRQVLLPQPRRAEAHHGVCEGAPDPVVEHATDLPQQGYRLTIGARRIAIAAADAAGIHHARMTLRQLRRTAGADLPCGVIEDWPDFPIRGVMLDISRDRVPTMETLYGLVDELSEWKFNHLELYTEHTFAYPSHPEVWRDADPMTPGQIRELDAYCSERSIELVPNQNSFGHMARWLKHPRYRDLAETPEGHTAWGQWRPYPFSLNPLDPRSIELVRSLYDELLPHFSSRRLNVGCDETVDLGQGRSREACERIGKGQVYLDFLKQVHGLVRDRGHIMHFWADIVLNHPELLSELPRDAVALIWGYEADHPFESQCAAVRQTGLPFYVCPGTSTWNSLIGRTEEMMGNIRSAALHGRNYGAAGFLVTDWGDNGHWQTQPFIYPGLAWAAGSAWCAQTNEESMLSDQLDRHVFRDVSRNCGRMLLALGSLYRIFPGRKANSSPLFHLLHRQDPAPELSATRPAEWRQAEIQLESLAAHLSTLRLGRRDGDLIVREIALGVSMARHACRRALDGKEVGLAVLVDEMRACWLARSRTGGLADSLNPLLSRLA